MAEAGPAPEEGRGVENIKIRPKGQTDANEGNGDG